MSDANKKCYKIKLSSENNQRRCWLGHSNAASENGFYPTVKEVGKFFSQEAIENDVVLKTFLDTTEYELYEDTLETKISPLRI